MEMGDKVSHDRLWYHDTFLPYNCQFIHSKVNYLQTNFAIKTIYVSETAEYSRLSSNPCLKRLSVKLGE